MTRAKTTSDQFRKPAGWIDQFRKPAGWRGRFILWKMNRVHSNLTDWGLAHASIKESDTILDVGCGGGRTVSKLAARAAQGKVYGIDYSPESVAASGRKNARWIAAGRVEILQGSVSQLPFPVGAFDLVTAVETQYFWPDLAADMREVFRVLKPGGSFILIAEIYKGGRKMANIHSKKYIEMNILSDTGMKILSVEEQRELFASTGYSDIQVAEEPDKEWICCVGQAVDLLIRSRFSAKRCCA